VPKLTPLAREVRAFSFQKNVGNPPQERHRDSPRAVRSRLLCATAFVPNYLMPKLRKDRRFPFATVMMYGPTASRATKYVAAVIPAPDAEPVALRRWFVAEGDIRDDTRTAKEITAFMQESNVCETVFSDRVTGCPHEEGVDYPLGRECPECPFWAETDRFTHGPKSPADDDGVSGYITVEEIIVALSEERGQPPREAFRAADVRREEIADRLLAALEVGLAAPSEASGETGQLFAHALYLLAKWREPRAFPFVIRWLALPDECAFDIGGDVPTTAGSRILASVCGGDRREIRALVENRDANEYCRSAALESLAILAAWGELPRENVIAYLRELIVEKLEREPSYVWSAIANLIVDLDAGELVPLIRQPYDDGLVDSFTIGWGEIEDRKSHTERALFEEFQHRHPPITDVAVETAWWAMYGHAAYSDEQPTAVDPLTAVRAPSSYDPPTPFVSPPRTGRNDQCPCGSGRKYKKCCGKNA
jgi:Protein of unknown function (DUF1186)/SEC-C motif